MLSSVTLADSTGTDIVFHQDTQNGKRQLLSAQGLRGIQNLRQSKRPRPQAHGGINETKFEDGSTITLIGEVMSTISIEDAIAEFGIIEAPMLQTLDVGPAVMKWQEGTSGNALQKVVKIDGDLTPVLQEAQAFLQYQAQFFAEDPRAYSQTLQTITGATLSTSGGGMTFPKTFPFTFASSGGGTVSFTNAGNRPTPPIFRIYGQCVNPQLVLLGTNYRLVFNGTINAGDYLEVNVAKRTVKLNGTTDRFNFIDGANSQWYELPAGTTNLQLIAASFDGVARVDVLGRSAFA